MKKLLMVCLSLLIAASLFSLPTTQAQCTPRSDWAVYTVVRGDTLVRIARRYQTSTAELVTANCLTNANRITVGQQLRVPSAGGGTPNQWTTAATFQSYQSGFMVWRGDTGEIRVYIGSYMPSGIGELLVYRASQYGSLPTQPFTAPPGLVAPIMGFNRVWGNFPTVSQRLGWATDRERSFTMRLTARNGIVDSFTLPTGQIVSGAGTNWLTSRYDGGNSTPVPTFPPPPNPTLSPILTITTQAAFQQYYNGFMVWRADTGTILIFGLGVGTYPQSSYAGLPDNVCDQVPPDFVCPINGFGRIWANDINTRKYLGWATASEQSYQATIESRGGFVLSITLPDGRTVYLDNGTTWHF